MMEDHDVVTRLDTQSMNLRSYNPTETSDIRTTIHRPLIKMFENLEANLKDPKYLKRWSQESIEMLTGY